MRRRSVFSLAGAALCALLLLATHAQGEVALADDPTDTSLPDVPTTVADPATEAGDVGEEEVVGQVDTLQGRHRLAEGREYEGYALLQQAADKGNKDARYSLYLPLLLGNRSSVAMDLPAAFKGMSDLAAEGHADAQWVVGTMHAMGLGVNSSQSRALVYYTFSALGGNPRANMALGFRYHAGVGVKRGCEMALSYYRSAADVVERDVQLTGGTVAVRERLSIADRKQQTMSQEDLAEFYQNDADQGSVQAQVVAGQLLYQGQGVAQDFPRALRYFNAAARQGNANAMAFLGEMHAAGHGVAQNNETALKHYQRAADKKAPAGQTGLGLLHLHGQGVKQSNEQAFKLFTAAASQGHGDGQLHLGFMYYNGLGTKRDYRKAMHYFGLAAQHGHVLAMYNLALMHATGVGTARNCEMATSLFKNVAERGRWAGELAVAAKAFQDGRSDEAATRYLLLGEMGYEVAQHNTAYVLEDGGLSALSQEGTHKRALVNWRRSAAQGEFSARVKIGDYLYYGHGTAVDLAAAADEYRMAADASNPQAMFNLAYMHEHGEGLPKDLHLAKRYYDMSLNTNVESQLPASLALGLLQLKFWWQAVTDDAAEGEAVSGFTLESVSDAILGFDVGNLDALLEGNENVLIGLLVVLLSLVLLARRLHTHMEQERRLRQHLRQQRLAELAAAAAAAEEQAAAAAEEQAAAAAADAREEARQVDGVDAPANGDNLNPQ